MIGVGWGVEFATLPPAAPHLENGPARMIGVGRLRAEKCYFGWLDALAAVGPSNGGAELVVVGDGPMAAAVRARARELGLLDRIRFAGARAENETLAEIAHADRSAEHTSELQSLMRLSYAVFCLQKKKAPHLPHCTYFYNYPRLLPPHNR